jgi:hypothetical protein
MSLVSLYDEASLWMTPSGAKDGKLYSIKPVPEYGSEQVTNGDFATDSDWVLTQATISNGKLLLSTFDGSYTAASQTLGVIGKTYRVSLDVADIVGIVSITIGGGTDFDITSNGTHSFEITSTTTTLEVKRKFGITNVSATIDNVSVKEVLVGDGDFTFSRGSNLAATRVDVNGLIEKGRENLLLQSNQFDTTWVLTNAPTLTSGQAGYDGSNDAWKLEASTTGSSRSIHQVVSSSGVQVFSVYVKAGTTDWIRINLSGIGNRYFDIGNGVVGGSGSMDGFINDVGGGWYRCSVLGNGSSTAPYVFLASDNGNLSVNAGDNIYIQDAQLEQGLVATDYIETGTSAAQSGILEDMPRLDYSGGASCPSLLLEPQRSNLITHSELLTDSSWTNQLGGTIDVSQASAVSGYNDAWKLNKDSGTFKSFRLQKTLASGNYTLTWFLKEGTISIAEFRFDGGLGSQFIDFDLSSGTHGTNANLSNIEMVAFNDGWYRCSASINTNLTNVHLYVGDASVSSGAGYIYAQYPQLEEGSYPTSYIPTYGTSQTRSKEQCNLNSVSGEIGQTQGTIFLDADLYKKTNTEFYIAISDGTLSNSIYLHQSSQSLRVNKRIAGVTEFLQVTSANWSSGRNKCAITYTATEMKIFVNGVLKDTEVINGLPSGLSKLTLGSRQDNLGELASDADYKQALLFPTALTDSECIALTKLG